MNGEMLTCGTAMGSEWGKPCQYLDWPIFVHNGPSEEFATELFKYLVLQATKVPVNLWQETR
jgi:hypothetical protein